MPCFEKEIAQNVVKLCFVMVQLNGRRRQHAVKMLNEITNLSRPDDPLRGHQVMHQDEAGSQQAM